jgi:hypothetical protein
MPGKMQTFFRDRQVQQKSEVAQNGNKLSDAGMLQTAL